jgi:hypothetical protein
MLRRELEQHLAVAQNRVAGFQAKSIKYAALAALVAALLVAVVFISN